LARSRSVHQSEKMFGMLPMFLTRNGVSGSDLLREIAVVIIAALPLVLCVLLTPGTRV
jgi:hypothetical protein